MTGLSQAVLLGFALILRQPAPAHQSQLAAEFSLQHKRFAAACQLTLSSVMSCPVELVTDHPLHLAAGSLAPQNGFGVGPAFITHFYSEDRDLSVNADAVRSTGGSWRAGVYFKAVLTPVPETVVVPIDPTTPTPTPTPFGISLHSYPVIDAYAQTTSLHTVSFYGLGPDSRPQDRTVFALRESVIGARVIYPLATRRLQSLNLALTGAINGRFVDVGTSDPADTPALTTRFDASSASGLTQQPGFVQFGEGVRVSPVLLNNRLRFNYGFSLAQFAASQPGQSFHRWTADLTQEFSFYRTVLTSPTRETHGPNDCSESLGDSPCPRPSLSRNRYGSAAFQMFATRSVAASSGVVPFYFQPTLGGSDMDGVRRLAGYDDYRFRGPGVFLLRERVEHYLYGVVGALVEFEQGTVATPGDGLHLSHLKHSTAAGVTLRAGGLPVASVTWGWGPEGHHLIAVVSASLLGGSTRPTLQ